MALFTTALNLYDGVLGAVEQKTKKNVIYYIEAMAR
jgi:hypothetical protein